MNTGETVTIYPYSPTDITSFGELTITTGNDRSMEKVTLYPRQEVV
ncbi:phage protein [Clostridioides difficile]|nr:phage protein [Clostridioides difficile]VIB54459.1 phage protein [Clostridioides difficile]VIG21892.1 phage protein [Clostridioides difficile]VII50327.1 phage protein [Clostridioides difficile]